jgi:hypothetical protein
MKKKNTAPHNPDADPPVPAKWKFIAGCVFVLVTLIFIGLTTFIGPKHFGYSTTSSAIVVQAVFAGVAFTILIDGSMSIETKQKLGNLTIFVLRATGGGAFAVFIAFLSMHLAQNATPFEVRLFLTDESGRSVEEAEIKMEGADAVISKDEKHGWRLVIHASSVPSDGQCTIVAANRNAFLYGRGKVTLDNRVEAITIEMKRDRSAIVNGRVVEDAANAVPISNARVFIEGNDGMWTHTDKDGNFNVASNAAPGELVYIHAEKTGYQTKQLPISTTERVEIRLPRSRL